MEGLGIAVSLAVVVANTGHFRVQLNIASHVTVRSSENVVAHDTVPHADLSNIWSCITTSSTCEPATHVRPVLHVAGSAVSERLRVHPVSVHALHGVQLIHVYFISSSCFAE